MTKNSSMTKLLRPGAVVIAASLIATSAHAISVTPYTDEATWAAAAGPFAAENFNSVASDTRITKFDDSGATTSVGELDFQFLGTYIRGGNYIDAPLLAPDSGGRNQQRDIDGSAYLRGAVRDASGTRTRLRVFLPEPVYAVAFDFSEINAPFLELRLDNSDPTSCCGELVDVAVTDSDSISLVSGFFGLVSDTAFNSVLFQPTRYDGPGTNTPGGVGFGLDNLRYASVPEPNVLALVGIGLLAIGVATRRRAMHN